MDRPEKKPQDPQVAALASLSHESQALLADPSWRKKMRNVDTFLHSLAVPFNAELLEKGDVTPKHMADFVNDKKHPVDQRVAVGIYLQNEKTLDTIKYNSSDSPMFQNFDSKLRMAMTTGADSKSWADKQMGGAILQETGLAGGMSLLFAGLGAAYGGLKGGTDGAASGAISGLTLGAMVGVQTLGREVLALPRTFDEIRAGRQAIDHQNLFDHLPATEVKNVFDAARTQFKANARAAAEETAYISAGDSPAIKPVKVPVHKHDVVKIATPPTRNSLIDREYPTMTMAIPSSLSAWNNPKKNGADSSASSSESTTVPQYSSLMAETRARSALVTIDGKPIAGDSNGGAKTN